jgi:uncharacterized protein (DUF983 family)
MPPEPLTKSLAFRRSLKLVCPECGVSPVFRPLRETRSTWDWFTPLDGCPRCGYAYQREDGYFLLATWVINYTLVAGLGLVIAFTLEHFYAPPMRVHILCVFLPLMVLSVLFARHAKSLYLALDHYCDPHRPELKRGANAADHPEIR